MSRPGYDMEIESPQGIQMSHVFLIVLALHVLVIGGALGYHWMRGRLGEGKAQVAKQEKGPVAPEGAGPKVAFRTGGFEPAEQRPLPLEERRVRPVDREQTGLDAMRLAQAKPAPEPMAQASAVAAPAPVAVAHVPPPVTAAPVQQARVQPQPQPAVAQAAEHVVGKGEMLGKIAKKYGVSVAALKQANGLQNDMIRIGQKLRVPAQAQAPAIQQMAAVTPAAHTAPVALSGPAAPAPAKATGADAERVYVVSKGDTLWGISKRFKMAPESIVRANKIADPGRLRVGMKLVIPLNTSGIDAGQKKGQATEVSSVAMSG